ncbi:MAG: TldD/PmbA family protein [bacterium]
MSQSRREFMQSAGMAATLAVAGSVLGPLDAAAARVRPPVVRREPAAMDPAIRELLLEAIDEARRGGAEFADARIARARSSSVSTREQQILNVAETDTMGLGVRVLVAGTWGFGATRDLTKGGVTRATRDALAIAKANRVAEADRVRLAPAPVIADGRWETQHTIDPFTVPVEEKADLLLRTNAAALTAPNVRFVTSSMLFVKEEKSYANTDGSVTQQTAIRSWLPFTATAVSSDRTDFQSRGEVIAPMGRGYEYLLEKKPVENARQWGEQAAEKLKAKSVEVGRYDLILHPSHLFLTIHESVAHPTELDRALGYEANYAGTSFVAPPTAVLGLLKFGSPLMHIVGDRDQNGSLAAIGWDDEGVQPDRFDIIKGGMFVDYQTTREQAPVLDWWYTKQGRPVRSHGCSYAQRSSDVQFQRMPNVSLMPGDKELSLEDLVAATDKGIVIYSRGSYSIDQQRYNAQFGGQLFYEVKGGKIVGMLKDVAYQMRTPDFWASLDMLGGPKSYELGGTFNDGKGQPGQANAVSHGCPPSRFRSANVVNTGRTG